MFFWCFWGVFSTQLALFQDRRAHMALQTPPLAQLVLLSSPPITRYAPGSILFVIRYDLRYISSLRPIYCQYPVFSVRPLLLFGFTAPLAGFLSFSAHLSATGTSHCPFFFLFSSIWRIFVCLNPPSHIPLPASPATTTHHPTLL